MDFLSEGSLGFWLHRMPCSFCLRKFTRGINWETALFVCISLQLTGAPSVASRSSKQAIKANVFPRQNINSN
jgi:hypothetical protein